MAIAKALIFGGNWKASMTPVGTIGFLRGFAGQLEQHADAIADSGAKIIIAPPVSCLRDARLTINECKIGSCIELAAQNPWPFKGAYTGATTLDMATDPLIGASYAIIGHSENRESVRHFYRSAWGAIKNMIGCGQDDLANIYAYVAMCNLNEAARLSEKNPASLQVGLDIIINRMVKESLAMGVTPIACVGETKQEREAGKTMEVVLGQITEALKGLSPEQINRVIVAYEPVWAINTGLTASPEQAQEVHAAIAGKLKELGATVIRLIYGGSMNDKNVAGLVGMPDIYGGLIGGASLKPDQFIQLIVNGIQAVK